MADASCQCPGSDAYLLVQVQVSDAHLVQVQPASHHRPSIIADHNSKVATLSPQQGLSQHSAIQPSLTRVIPTLESLSLVHPAIARVESTAGSASNPLVGAVRAQSKAVAAAARVKHAATMPVPVVTAILDADKMQKFRWACFISFRLIHVLPTNRSDGR